MQRNPRQQTVPQLQAVIAAARPKLSSGDIRDLDELITEWDYEQRLRTG
jgi:hypothetical protein